ncbi:hypothetical protein [Aliarcobacter butzleri]|uniref:Uncharacterized protein n=1 Tax=Aliarcobacter butzleri L348 TaxID=1447256 RepID=A0A0G9JS31_9BACT|nr:hypothetical protein [Aliarcobacter butzleri]KLD96419.1 hypothetical protein AA20_12000 [Aliarcobacter butzleri L348]MDN5094726.1 hypothetical protein [Aliarcobacter butzleri]
MKEKIYYYADKPSNRDVDEQLKIFANKYSWTGLIELNYGLESILKEIINKLIWYRRYQDDIKKKSSKKLTQKEINQRYVEFVQRLKDELRHINKYLDKTPVNIDLPNTSPSILKELEDILKNSKFSKTNIDKIIEPLKEFTEVEKIVSNKSYEIKKGRDMLIELLIHNQKGTLREHLQSLKKSKK